jgi:hypothetical protein
LLIPLSFAFSPEVGSTSFLVIKDPMEVCLLFAAANVSNRIFAVTAKPLLFPSSSTRHSIGSPCGLLSPPARGECRAYSVPLNRAMNGEGSLFPPVALVFTTSKKALLVPATLPFGSSLSASLACST